MWLYNNNRVSNKDIYHTIQCATCVVGWDCRIHRLLLCNECPGYDAKQSDGEVPGMLELWGMQIIPLLPLLPGPLLPEVVAPDRVLSMGQVELNGGLNTKLNCVK